MERISSTYYLMAGLLIIFLTQCITPFDPEITDSVDLINIDGSIIKGQEVQKVVVSRSTSLHEKTFNPVEGCTVYIMDNSGNRFDFYSDKKGVYTATIDDAFLKNDNSYQLYVITSSGEIYESAFETIYKNQPIDSAYYLAENQYSYSEGKEIEGLQFYIDLKGSESTSRFYKWTVDEAWEHHAAFPITYSWRVLDTVQFFFPRSDSLYYCYDFATTTGLYISNTLNLEKNEKKKIPLHFVDLKSIKLSVKYSYMVHQYSLSEDAYNYWNQKKVDLMESGGMYTTQPAQAISNIRNINNPDEVVLGFFWASERTERRFFNAFHYSYPHENCDLTSLQDFLDEFSEDSLYWQWNPDTLYFYVVPENPSPNITAPNDACFDCRLQGGTINKPEYWNND